MRHLLLITSLFSFLSSNAQHIEWAASSAYVDLAYQYSSVSPTNDIVVAGRASRNWTHKKPYEIYDGFGYAVQDLPKWFEEMDLIMCYTSTGNVKWTRYANTQSSELMGVSHDENGNTVLLYFIEAWHYRNEQRGTGYSFNRNLSGYDTLEAGYNLITLDEEGETKSIHHITRAHEYDLRVNQFVSYPGGGFVISGFADAGSPVPELDVKVGKAGGDFLLKLHKDGSMHWMKLVNYQRNTCCTWSAEGCKVAVSPQGNIYLAGTFMDGGEFDGKVYMSTPHKDDNKYTNKMDAYVASYAASGKLNWVNVSKSRALLYSIAAGYESVVIGLNPIYSDKIFGQAIDTTNKRKMSIAQFNTKGKLKWIRTAGMDRASSIKIDREENVYILGTNGYGSGNYNNSMLIGSDTLTRRDKMYLARFDKKGKYQWVKPAHIPVSTSNEPLELLIDQCNNFFIVGHLFVGLPMDLALWDKAFIKGHAYGSSPLIARFNNTIPPEVSEGGGSCAISPGPWTIRNYPNPFHLSTTIEYSLSYDDKVSIEIFDLQGNSIANLLQNKAQDAGTYTIPFKTSVAAGTYVAVITGTSTIASCKLLVIK